MWARVRRGLPRGAAVRRLPAALLDWLRAPPLQAALRRAVRAVRRAVRVALRAQRGVRGTVRGAVRQVI